MTVRKREAGELTIIDAQLDVMLRRATLARDGNRCCWCGSTKRLNTAHIIPKRKGHFLRWDLLNALQLCYRCHLERWHKDPLEAAAWFISTYPERNVYLEQRRDMYQELSLEEKQSLLRFLEMKAISYERQERQVG